MGQATIFAGQKIKTLKDALSLNGQSDIISRDVNPQTSAVDAKAGSLLLNPTSGIMYRKLDAGSTTNWVEVGAGTGGKNYIKNPDFDGGATTSWSMQKVSLSSFIPTGNIGAADAGHTISTSSSSPLEGANSLLVQGASAFTAGNCLVSAAFTIDREDVAKVMGWSFAYEAITTNMDFSGTTANTWAVYIAEVTTGTPDTVVSWIQPAGVYNLVQGSGVGLASGTFQTTATDSSAYRIVLVCINSEAAATTLKVDNFQLGPQRAFQGPSGPVGEIIATGSITPPAGFLYCNGQSVSVSQYQDLFNSIGYTYGGAGSSFNVPDLRGVFLRGAGSQTIGAETYTATLGTKQNDATAKNGLFDSGHVHTQQAPNLATGGAINVRQFVSGTGSVPTSENITTASGAANLSSTDTETRPANVAVAYHIRYLATYQMSNDTDTRVVAARATSSNSGAWPTADTVLNYSSVTYDTNALITTGAGWNYRVGVSGYYKVSATHEGSTSGATTLILRIRKNGTAFAAGTFPVNAATGNIVVRVDGQNYFNAGDTIDIIAASSAATGTFLSGVAGNVVQIERLSGPATIAASESVQAKFYASANGTCNSTTPINFDSKVYDSHGAVTTGAAWKFTAPISGKYLVTTFINASVVPPGNVYLRIYTNGGAPESFDYILTTQGTASGSEIMSLNAGDYIDIRTNANFPWYGSAITNSASLISISRIGN
jgi:microcystin-dependent protein